MPVFEHCSTRELSRVASIAFEGFFPAGHTLMAEGKRGNELMITSTAPSR